MSPRKPLVWSQGLVEGARIFVNDSESPYANQYGEIAKVRNLTVSASSLRHRMPRATQIRRIGAH